MEYQIRPVGQGDREWVLGVIRHWGADFVVTRGRRVYPQDLDGFVAVDSAGQRRGLLTYEIVGDQCEIVTLDAFEKFAGIGSALIEQMRQMASQHGCRRLWLITTNDNLDAIRFYQRRGFVIAAVHVNALSESRRLKPSIPRVGMYGIPLRDEIEFEMTL
ncbi:MAG: GNAT family N-acetyltransferase [candidate division Zixibacteria bacterium]|nr:GNAT family N-acetyltransferase [candidate division Zixibacteria bacterium]